MPFELTDVQRDIQKAAREFAEKEFDLDLALGLEREGRFPESIFKKACQLGFVGINYPEQYGGQSFGLFENILVAEAFCRKDSGMGISINLADKASEMILRHGNENQKRQFLIPVTQGKMVNTVALIDSFSNGNLPPLPTRSEENGSEYIVNGRKSYVVNGSIAKTMVVSCQSGSGQDLNSARSVMLIIEKDQEGVNFTGPKRMMGMRMSSIHDMSLNHVRVPKDRRVGEGDEPLKTYLTEQRVKTSAQALGIAQGAFDLAVRHAREREQFGRRIIQFQGIQFMMAELYTLIEASRNLVYRAACSYDSQSSDLDRISSVAKLFATDVAVKTAIDSIQIHGGVGLMKEYSIERMLRDAKTIQNLEETNLVQKALIAKKIIS